MSQKVKLALSYECPDCGYQWSLPIKDVKTAVPAEKLSCTACDNDLQGPLVLVNFEPGKKGGEKTNEQPA